MAKETWFKADSLTAFLRLEGVVSSCPGAPPGVLCACLHSIVRQGWGSGQGSFPLKI